MKKKILILSTAFSLLIGCALTLNADQNKEAAQSAWNNLKAYNKASTKMKQLSIEIEEVAFFTPEGLKLHKAALKTIEQVIEKSTEALKESKKALQKAGKDDSSFGEPQLPDSLIEDKQEKIKDNIKDINPVLEDIEEQKDIIIDYANTKS